jgi:hypothetical protein
MGPARQLFFLLVCLVCVLAAAGTGSGVQVGVVDQQKGRSSTAAAGLVQLMHESCLQEGSLEAEAATCLTDPPTGMGTALAASGVLLLLPLPRELATGQCGIPIACFA